MRAKRPYEITDVEALFQNYPQFFKQTPDHTKIRKALSLGLDLPGVAMIDSDLEAAIKKVAA